MKKEYSLPNGKGTTSVCVYVREWQKLCRPLCKAIPGLDLIGIDPQVQFGYGTYCFTLPVKFLQELNKKLNPKRKGKK